MDSQGEKNGIQSQDEGRKEEEEAEEETGIGKGKRASPAASTAGGHGLQTARWRYSIKC